jgi:sodium transport system ATP-binding protein
MIKVENLSKMFVRTNLEGDEHTPKGLLRRDRQVTKKEEFYAVNHVSFEVETGEIVGILGPNGAGKTTLLRMLGNLMEPSCGSVTIQKKDGTIITDMVQMKKEIGFLSENTKLYHRFSTREMLHMLGEIYGMDKAACEERISEIFTVLNMEAFGDNRIEKLSTGQMQRASIARCLIHDPQIYIFDEPTLGLDIMSADAIVEFMKGQKERGKTVLYSTHYLEEAQYLCDRIIMIKDGQIVAEGSPESLLERYQAANLREAFHTIMKEQKEVSA